MNLEPLTQEFRTYLRELPRLLAEGHEGRHVLIKDDEVLSIWDTSDDVFQAGIDRFGVGVPFLGQPIDPKFLDCPWPEFHELPHPNGRNNRMNLEPLTQEFRTYLRELPRLLAEGHEGRFVLIKGDEILSLWDTSDDVLQAGFDRFGLGVPFLGQPIDPKFLDYPWPQEFLSGKAC